MHSAWQVKVLELRSVQPLQSPMLSYAHSILLFIIPLFKWCVLFYYGYRKRHKIYIFLGGGGVGYSPYISNNGHIRTTENQQTNSTNKPKRAQQDVSHVYGLFENELILFIRNLSRSIVREWVLHMVGMRYTNVRINVTAIFKPYNN